MEEEDVGEDEDAETSIHHALGDQHKESTIGHVVHPATTTVVDTDTKRKDIRTTKLQRISWEDQQTHLHDIIGIVK